MYRSTEKPHSGEKQKFIDAYQTRLCEVIDDIAYRVPILNKAIDFEVRKYVATKDMNKPRTKLQERMLEKASLRITEDITHRLSLQYINEGLVKFLTFFIYIMGFPTVSYLTYERMKKKHPFLFRQVKVLIPKHRQPPTV